MKLGDTGFFIYCLLCDPFTRVFGSLLAETLGSLLPKTKPVLVTQRGYLKCFPMEKKALALKAMIKKHGPKKQNLDPRKWMRQETVKGFADFMLDRNSDKGTDDSFDNKEMCEYTSTTTSLEVL